MSIKAHLKLAWCDAKAASYAAKHWHYTKTAPGQKSVSIGVWENGEFCGCLIYGWGANRHIGSPYGLENTQIAELVRVALRTGHKTPVSRILTIANKMIARRCPNLRLLLSYADTGQGHHGGIYQANGWLYLGHATPQSAVILHGKKIHKRNISAQYGHCSVKRLRQEVDPKASWVAEAIKYTYVLPLDQEIQKVVKPMSKPYPKRATSIGADASTFQVEEGGSQPTVALQSNGRD